MPLWSPPPPQAPPPPPETPPPLRPVPPPPEPRPLPLRGEVWGCGGTKGGGEAEEAAVSGRRGEPKFLSSHGPPPAPGPPPVPGPPPAPRGEGGGARPDSAPGSARSSGAGPRTPRGREHGLPSAGSAVSIRPERGPGPGPPSPPAPALLSPGWARPPAPPPRPVTRGWPPRSAQAPRAELGTCCRRRGRGRVVGRFEGSVIFSKMLQPPCP